MLHLTTQYKLVLENEIENKINNFTLFHFQNQKQQQLWHTGLQKVQGIMKNISLYDKKNIHKIELTQAWIWTSS